MASVSTSNAVSGTTDPNAKMDITDTAQGQLIQGKGTDPLQPNQGMVVGKNTANLILHPSVDSGVTDKGGVEDSPPVRGTFGAAEGLQEAPMNPDAPQAPAGTQAARDPVGRISSAENAVPVLKAKVNLLHKVINDMGHFSTLAVGEVEALVADIKWLTTLIASKK